MNGKWYSRAEALGTPQERRQFRRMRAQIAPSGSKFGDHINHLFYKSEAIKTRHHSAETKHDIHMKHLARRIAEGQQISLD